MTDKTLVERWRDSFVYDQAYYAADPLTEVDRYPASAGEEGDPISLAKRRTAAFSNRKIILVFTPTNKSQP